MIAEIASITVCITAVPTSTTDWITPPTGPGDKAIIAPGFGSTARAIALNVGSIVVAIVWNDGLTAGTEELPVDAAASACGPYTAAMPQVEFASLDSFLASVECRALRMAEVATRDRDQALDLVQDAMIQLSRRYAARPSAEWKPLFYRCLQNRIRDWHRRQAVRRRLFWVPRSGPDADEPTVDAPDPSAADGADTLQREQALHRLETALRALPARQREVFELRIWEGLDVADTALAMGCGEGSVKTHLSRALTRLRSELEGTWP